MDQAQYHGPSTWWQKYYASERNIVDINSPPPPPPSRTLWDISQRPIEEGLICLGYQHNWVIGDFVGKKCNGLVQSLGLIHTFVSVVNNFEIKYSN